MVALSCDDNDQTAIDVPDIEANSSDGSVDMLRFHDAHLDEISGSEQAKPTSNASINMTRQSR